MIVIDKYIYLNSDKKTVKYSKAVDITSAKNEHGILVLRGNMVKMEYLKTEDKVGDKNEFVLRKAKLTRN